VKDLEGFSTEPSVVAPGTTYAPPHAKRSSSVDLLKQPSYSNPGKQHVWE